MRAPVPGLVCKESAVDVKDLCLGALTFGEASGYDLKKFFEETFSHFCGAGYGSIYPALAELTDAKLVTCHEIPQQGKPDRKVYRLTAVGRETFLARLEKTSPQHKVKSDFLLVLYFAHLLPPARLETLLDERVAELDHHLGLIRQCQQNPGSDEAVGAKFVHEFGKTVMAAARDYLLNHRQALVAAVAAAVDQDPESNRRDGHLRRGTHNS